MGLDYKGKFIYELNFDKQKYDDNDLDENYHNDHN